MRRFLPLLAATAALTSILASAFVGVAIAQPTLERSTAKPPPTPFNLPASVTTGRLTVVGQGDAVAPAGPEPKTQTAPLSSFNLPAQVTTPALSVVGLGAQPASH